MKGMYLQTCLLALFVLGACSSKTYYIRSDKNGFTDHQINDTVYLITVKSQFNKDSKRLQDIFYLRAAEIAKENGFPFFYTVESTEDLINNNPKAKPFKQRTITAIFYETITLSGVVKLLQEYGENSETIPYQIFSSDDALRRREYLLLENELLLQKNENPTNLNSPDSPTNVE